MQHLPSFLNMFMFLSMTTTTPVATVQGSSNILRAGSHLKAGEFLTSNNKAYYAVLQHDGNFEVYVSNHWVPKNARWSSKTGNKYPFIGPYNLFMQTDGNVVMYDTYNRAVWNSQTPMKGAKPHLLAMQDDGNLVLYDGNGKSTWHTVTGGNRQLQGNYTSS